MIVLLERHFCLAHNRTLNFVQKFGTLQKLLQKDEFKRLCTPEGEQYISLDRAQEMIDDMNCMKCFFDKSD